MKVFSDAMELRSPAGSRPSRAPTLALGVCLLLATGCASSGYLTVRHNAHSPLSEQLKLLSKDGPQPTARTWQLLRRHDLATLQKKRPREVLARLNEEIVEEPTEDNIYAFAELSFIHGKHAERAGQETDALDSYGAAVAHAYIYLFDPQFDYLRNPYDPHFRQSCDLYNSALEAALRIVNRQGKLVPGSTQVFDTGKQQFEVTVTTPGGWHPDDFERLEFVSDYNIEGLTNRYHTYGLGVPLIAVRRQHPDETPAEQYYPPGLSFPVTAFLRVHADATGKPLSACSGKIHCTLELHDPLVASELDVAGRHVPMETDLSTPLAYFLNNPAFKESKYLATWGLLNGNTTREAQGLYMLEPYNPNKIPVLMVHGLWSSPLTWMEMFNDLTAYPEIRQRYQFWFYLYPTGQPFWVSATEMREDLARAERELDPRQQSIALRQMVLVGHSMGGLIAKLQTVDSGDDYWRLISDKPFDELKASPESRERLARTVYFQPNPSVRRVITLGTPHRGSDFANDTTRYLARKLITLPKKLLKTSNELVRENPGFFHNTELLTTTTSIDSLSPKSPILSVLLESQRAPWVKYDNVVGVLSEDDLLASVTATGDGIVAYKSAHLDNVESEITVQADHVSVHRHPRSILHVRQVLRQHFGEFFAEQAGNPEVLPASLRTPLPNAAPHYVPPTNVPVPGNLFISG